MLDLTADDLRVPVVVTINNTESFTVEGTNLYTDTEFADGANYFRVYRRNSAVGNPFGFAGGWLVSGNYQISSTWRSVKQPWYFWNRHYEPEYLLRWLQPDPIGPWGDGSGGGYLYCVAQPSIRRDSAGLDPFVGPDVIDPADNNGWLGVNIHMNWTDLRSGEVFAQKVSATTTYRCCCEEEWHTETYTFDEAFYRHGPVTLANPEDGWLYRNAPDQQILSIDHYERKCWNSGLYMVVHSVNNEFLAVTPSPAVQALRDAKAEGGLALKRGGAYPPGLDEGQHLIDGDLWTSSRSVATYRVQLSYQGNCANQPFAWKTTVSGNVDTEFGTGNASGTYKDAYDRTQQAVEEERKADRRVEGSDPAWRPSWAR